MVYYVLIFLAALGAAANFAVTKVYQLNRGNTLETGAIFNCLVGLVGSLIYFVVCEFKIELTAFSVILSIVFTLLVGAYTIIGFKIMSLGSMAVYTVFLMLGGMILPYFYGLLFLDEEITIMKVIALLMMTIAIILQNRGDKKKGKALFYILCISVFILNGLTSVVSKIHQSYPEFDTVSNNGFVLLKNLARFLAFGAMIPFVRKKGNKVFDMKPKLYVVIACSAILSSVSYFLQLFCATYVPATVQFPVMSGGTIVFTALFGMICFKEKISSRQALCLLLCIISTIVFVL
ncbi:MAG: EamA family transporter [Clostridia bacterium]|nr:EamA family transporter [Clostridia bacterium]